MSFGAGGFAGGGSGTQGPQGAAGASGAQGPQGDDGAAGSQGPQGDAGAAGSQGPQGYTGADGAAGAAGAPGFLGTTVTVSVGGTVAIDTGDGVGLVEANCTLGPCSVLLPDATDPANLGRVIAVTIVATAGGAGIVVDPFGAQTINGVATREVYGLDTAEMYCCDGTGWRVAPAAVGPQGAQGDAGAQGAQGAQGDTGAAGTTYTADSWDFQWQGSDGDIGFSTDNTASWAVGTFQTKSALYLTSANSNSGGAYYAVTDPTTSFELRANLYLGGTTSGSTSNGYLRFDAHGHAMLMSFGSAGFALWSGTAITEQFKTGAVITDWVTVTVRGTADTGPTDTKVSISFWLGEVLAGTAQLSVLTTANYSGGRFSLKRTAVGTESGMAWIKYRSGLNQATPAWTYKGQGYAGSATP